MRAFLLMTALATSLCAQAPAPEAQASTDLTIQTKMVSGKHEIPVCASLPLKGEVSIMGNALFDGMSLFFNKIKKEKNDLPFTYALTTLDDEAEITKTRKNIKKLQSSSPLFLSLAGTDIVAGILKYVTRNQICALFPIDGATKHRTSETQNMLFFRASYEHEIDALINYSINELDKKKIAIFYEGSEWGEDALASFKRVLKKYKLTSVAEASYPQHTLNVTKAADTIAAKAPQAIICIAHARPAYNFIRQIINKGMYQTAILGLSQMFYVQKPIKNSRGIHIITSSVVPDPTKSTLKIAQEYRADMKKYFPNKTLSPFSFEGYINAALLVEATKLIQSPFTAEKIIQTLQGLKDINFKGLELSFDPATRTLSRGVWINAGNDTEWIKAKNKAAVIKEEPVVEHQEGVAA